MNSPPSACAPPSEGSATKRIRGGGAKRGAPRKGKPRTVLGQAKHASRRRRLKSGKPARHGRRGSSRTNAQAGPNWGKTKQRPRQTASRIAVRAARAQNCAADGRRMAGKKAQPTPSPLRLATEARAPFFALRKSQRAARGVRARPQFSRSRARRSQRNLYFCNAPRTRPTDRVGFPVRLPGARTNPTRDAARNGRSPLRERLEQPSRKTTPKPNGKQAGGEWRVKRIARKAAPQGNRREKPPANSGRRQNHFRISAVNPHTCRRPRAASRPTAAATCQALKSKRCRHTPLRRTAKSLRLDLTATAKTISKKAGEGRAKPAGIIKQFALDYAANDPGRSAQNNARLPNARESPSAIKPNKMKPREARAGARISRRER